jgi:Leucine-rich repeat (LRR) protein
MRMILLGMVLFVSMARAEEFVPVCDRTPQIRAYLVRSLHLNCEDIDAEVLKKIDTLFIEEAGIKNLKAGDFSGMKLTRLSLANNLIQDLSPDTFADQTEITELDLSSNKLSYISDKLFARLKKLRVLDLSNNSLTLIEADTFLETKSLFALALNSNKIENLDPALLSGLGQLIELNLSDNNLKELKLGVFDDLVSLSSLGLRQNPLEKIPDLFFIKIPLVKLISVDGCPLTRTTKAAFKGVLQVIGLPKNFGVDRKDGWDQ